MQFISERLNVELLLDMRSVKDSRHVLFLGLIVLFGTHALTVFGLNNHMPWDCPSQFGDSAYYVNECYRISLTGMIPIIIGYIFGIYLIQHDRKALSELKPLQSMFLVGLFFTISFVPSWQLFYEIDCPNQECNDLRFRAILLESMILPMAVGVVWLQYFRKRL